MIEKRRYETPLSPEDSRVVDELYEKIKTDPNVDQNYLRYKEATKDGFNERKEQ